MNASATARDKFRDLLRELFQFEHGAGLDFGIYRIMNHKREVIAKFIEHDLADAVSENLRARLHDARELQSARLFSVRADASKIFGEGALDENNELAEAFHFTPAGKAYLKAYNQAGPLPSHAQLEENAFNHLYAFFSRYYEDGDFISKRRYAKRERYAIPYNGDEVYLHWANRDSYYIKTGERFSHYAFHHGGYAVRFELRDADVEKDNRKGETRFFFPLVKDVGCGETDIVIPFVYRPLEKDEKNGGNGKQEDILKTALPGIEKKLSAPARAALLAVAGEDDGDNATVLETHMRRYARRNTADYFIHKDLRGFLIQELDFFIKNEVLDLDDLEQAGEFASEGRFHLMQTVRECGVKIIDFLAQIENFQKQLFEKKKFVIDTHYCVAVGRIACDKLRKKILASAAQWAEWAAFAGEKITGAKARAEFLRDNPTLLVDTAHFDAAFKDDLLAQFDDIDGECDGVLLSSENFQGLNLLAEKYRAQVKCFYIDPPYNTAASEIIYKNGYKHSSWMTLLENRIFQSMQIMGNESVFIVAIDDAEMVYLCHVLDACFPTWERNMVIINHHPGGAGLEGTNISRTHEYAIFMTPPDVKILRGEKQSGGKDERSFARAGTAESNLRIGRPNSFYAILVDAETSKVMGAEKPPVDDDYPKGNTPEGWVRIYPVGMDGTERVWRRSYESFLTEHEEGNIICKNGKAIYQVIDRSDYRKPVFSNWTDKKYNAGTHGSNLLTGIMGKAGTFSYPKSIHTVQDCVSSCVHDDGDGIVLDFFAGSGTTGHAVINLNREDGGRRKFILVEMGEYFGGVLLPRLKKVAWTPEWKDGKPRRAATAEEVDRAPRMFKYHRLESYEDALENIAFTDDDSAQKALKFSDYLLSYMLKWETRDSRTLLNLDKLQTPFDYRLRLRRNGDFAEEAVDVPETFNYLLGLHVQTRKIYLDGKRRYLLYTGHVGGRTAMVIWRDTAGWKTADCEREKEFIKREKLTAGADVVYVNGDSLIEGAQSLEALFKKRLLGQGE